MDKGTRPPHATLSKGGCRPCRPCKPGALSGSVPSHQRELLPTTLGRHRPSETNATGSYRSVTAHAGLSHPCVRSPMRVNQGNHRYARLHDPAAGSCVFGRVGSGGVCKSVCSVRPSAGPNRFGRNRNSPGVFESVGSVERAALAMLRVDNKRPKSPSTPMSFHGDWKTLSSLTRHVAPLVHCGSQRGLCDCPTVL